MLPDGCAALLLPPAAPPMTPRLDPKTLRWLADEKERELATARKVIASYDSVKAWAESRGTAEKWQQERSWWQRRESDLSLEAARLRNLATRQEKRK